MCLSTINDQTQWYLAFLLAWSGSSSSPIIKFDARLTSAYLNHPGPTSILILTHCHTGTEQSDFLVFCRLELNKTAGWTRMFLMNVMHNDLNSHRLSWTGAVDLTQNCPLWRLSVTSGAMHSPRIVVLARNYDCNDLRCIPLKLIHQLTQLPLCQAE